MLEVSLISKYGSEFSDVGWHGRFSQQRILWQDTEFLEVIKDPNMIRAILANHRDRTESDLGAGNTLASMVMHGVAFSTPTYLIAAAPSWKHTPKSHVCGPIPGMGNSFLDSDSDPWSVNNETFRLFSGGMEAVQQVLMELSPELVPADSHLRARKAILNANLREMVGLFNRLFTNAKTAQALVSGEAGSSTGRMPICTQAYGVLNSYNDVYKFTDTRHAKAIGYGMISHALDARHLTAVLWDMSPSNTEFKMADSHGKAQCRALLNLAKDPQTDDEYSLNFQIKARIQQVMHVILDSNTLRVSDGELAKADRQHEDPSYHPNKDNMAKFLLTQLQVDS